MSRPTPDTTPTITTPSSSAWVEIRLARSRCPAPSTRATATEVPIIRPMETLTTTPMTGKEKLMAASSSVPSFDAQ